MIMVLSFQPISLKLGRPGKLQMVIRSWVQIPDHIPLPSPLRYLEFQEICQHSHTVNGHMCVIKLINHNWSTTKHRFHPQSVAEGGQKGPHFVLAQGPPEGFIRRCVCMLTSLQAANWWTLCDKCGLSVIRFVILSVSRITATVISRFR